ncbi:MAG TPA: hypothetical protein VFI47_12095 [Acidimicrobiales bacterium]|nr:hypothetical protein [Acidimicrobiales bacterium]
MSTTDEPGPADALPGGDEPPGGRRSGRAAVARRYGPVAAAVALVVGAVAVFGGGGEGGGENAAPGDGGVPSEDELIQSGPMTPAKAKLLGETVQFGPSCDTGTGRIKVPIVLVPPCVEPFTGDNGGATGPGVTGDEIRIIYYQTDPVNDPLAAATLRNTGAEVDAASARETAAAYVTLYNKVFETYGRTVVVETFTGSGASDDRDAARADAVAIAEKEPFAVIGGPIQATEVFGPAIAAERIVCGPGCSGAPPEATIEEYAPYLWPVGPTPEQAAALVAEMVGKLAGPGKATMAGDPALHDRDRRYALVHYDTPDGDQRPAFEAMRDELSGRGVELTTDVEYALDLARMQENARTTIAKLADAGITTVIFYGDPLTPAALTIEATAQDYHPEWILGPSVLADSTIFARGTDGEQWKNGFGMTFPAARGAFGTSDAYRIHRWAYGEDPPNSNADVIEPPIRAMFAGIHMAGPNLTPETFRDALFRSPVGGGRPTVPQVSVGEHGVWPDLDWGGVDDMGIVWWDPTAVGEDEVGNPGTGMYRYANGGARYTIGHLPDTPEEAGLFDVQRSVTVYQEIPAGDRAPDYPPPP